MVTTGEERRDNTMKKRMRKGRLDDEEMKLSMVILNKKNRDVKAQENIELKAELYERPSKTRQGGVVSELECVQGV
jgi:hypothetical protein